jgi:hypothetical protein
VGDRRQSLRPPELAHRDAHLPQLPLEELAAELDRALLFLALEPGTDLGARAVGGDDREPVVVRLLAVRGGDLDDVAVPDLGLERHPAPVDPAADAGLADLAVDAVGEVEDRGAAREGEHVAARGEAVDLVRVEVDLERVEELARRGALGVVEQGPQPGHPRVLDRRAGALLLVAPVGGDAVLRDGVHVVGADLDLEGVALGPDHGGVEGLVGVGLGDREVVLEPSRHRRPAVVDQSEGGVAVGHRRDDDAEGQEVEDVGDVDALPLELGVDRVQVLDPALDRAPDAVGREQLLEHGLDLGEPAVGRLAPLLDLLLQLLGLSRGGGSGSRGPPSRS